MVLLNMPCFQMKYTCQIRFSSIFIKSIYKSEENCSSRFIKLIRCAQVEVAKWTLYSGTKFFNYDKLKNRTRISHRS